MIKKNKIILLTYKNRSGSTFLINKLDKYKDICSVSEGGGIVKLLDNPEANFTESSFNSILRKISNPEDKLFSWNLFIEDLTTLKDCVTNWEAFQNILQVYKNKNKPEANYIIFKHPRINSIIKNFGSDFFNKNEVYLIFLVRDGRAIYASSKFNKQSTKNIPMEVNPFLSAKGWRTFLKNIENNIKKISSKSSIIIRYEDLVEKYEETIFKVISFLGCKRDLISSSLLVKNLHKKQRHLHPNIDKRADVSLVSNWKNKLSKKEIIAFQYKNTEHLENYGYKILLFDYFEFNKNMYWMFCILKSFWFKLKSFYKK